MLISAAVTAMLLLSRVKVATTFRVSSSRFLSSSETVTTANANLATITSRRISQCALSRIPAQSFHCYSPRTISGTRLHSTTRSFGDVVSSTKSNTVKRIQALLKKRKKRIEQAQTIVEGPKMVFDLLESPETAHLVQSILISSDDYATYMNQLQQTLDDDTINSLSIQIGTPEVLKACSDTMSPQGIIATVDIPSLEISPDHESMPLYLVLDGVSDPGNLGTLLRSSLAVGVTGVLLMPECCDVWNPKAVRSAMGASFQVPIVEVSQGWRQTEDVLRNLGVTSVYGATMMMMAEECDGQTSRPYFDIDWVTNPVALVIGSEGMGLCREIRSELASSSNDGDAAGMLRAVHVPMAPGIESLNAAVCGSVILFEYLRQKSYAKEPLS